MIKNKSHSIDYHRSRKVSVRPTQPVLKKTFHIRTINSFLDHKLNNEYNFGRFMEGECNMLARSAAIVVGNIPGATEFNPFIICGNSGTGKTHLAQATGILIKEKFPDKYVCYVNATNFQSEFDESVRHNNKNDLIQFYKKMDVLILDDIHKFIGNEQIPDFFFQIFKQFNKFGKQIILTSERPIAELQRLETCLQSQFSLGLQVDLQKPDYATRLSVLKKKTCENSIELPEVVFDFLAGSQIINYRELDSILFTINQELIKNNIEITLHRVCDIAQKIVNTARREITIEHIQKIVCDYYDITLEQVQGINRKKEIVQARHVSMYFSKCLTKASLSSIGSRTGARNHATVLHACKTIYKNIKENVRFSNQINEIERKLKYSIF